MNRFNEQKTVIPKCQKENAIRSKNISNNTEKIFQKKYKKKLFLEDNNRPIYLCDVYIMPILIDKYFNEKENKKEKNTKISDNAIDYINNFIKNSVDKVLFIEGVAGVGKSSLLSRLSVEIYGTDIFYKSLKDYLDIEIIQLKKEIIKTFLLSDNDCDKVLFLDGLDEIWNKIDLNEFKDDLNFFIERNYKIVFTLRPGYVPYNLYKRELKLCKLEVFGLKEKKDWIKAYKNLKKDDFNDEVIKNLVVDKKFEEVTSIPIMLYIICNRNINLSTIVSMPQLYERVFDSLKEDKGGKTKQKLENDYICAQRLAYLMQAKGVLALTKRELTSMLIIDDSFYSSVYIDKIIEGEEILEFVHKTIQEFFAAKWIYNQITYCRDDKYAIILSEHMFSKEIIENLKFFFDSVPCNINTMFNKIVCDGFPYYKENLCNWNQYKEYSKNIVINTINIYSQILYSNIEIDKCSQIESFFDIMENIYKKEKKIYEIRNIKFNECFFEHMIIRNCNFYNIIIEKSLFINCIFEHIAFFRCTFMFSTTENEILFRNCQFNNVTFRVEKNRIRFENCTFVLYNSKLTEEVAAEIQKCELDKNSLVNLQICIKKYGIKNDKIK